MERGTKVLQQFVSRAVPVLLTANALAVMTLTARDLSQRPHGGVTVTPGSVAGQPGGGTARTVTLITRRDGSTVRVDPASKDGRRAIDAARQDGLSIVTVPLVSTTTSSTTSTTTSTTSTTTPSSLVPHVDLPGAPDVGTTIGDPGKTVGGTITDVGKTIGGVIDKAGGATGTGAVTGPVSGAITGATGSVGGALSGGTGSSVGLSVPPASTTPTTVPPATVPPTPTTVHAPTPATTVPTLPPATVPVPTTLPHP